MPIIHPATYRPAAERKRRFKARYLVYLLCIVVVAAAANYFRPLPAATVQLMVPTLPAAQEPVLAWPSTGQAAVGADGFGVLSSYGPQTPQATASIAKVITALCVLQKLPLGRTQAGPVFTISPNDIDIYNRYAAQDGSVLPVADGETLTERQALEALLLPSANNIADSLATWIFNGQGNYAAYADQFLAEHGLANTHVGSDASGFDASTTSTASDLVQLGLLALHNQTLMDIAGMQSTTLPVAGVVYNYDTVLGVNGINGLKTGNSAADTGAFLFTARTQVSGQTVRTVGVVMGAPDLNQALASASGLAGSMAAGFKDDVLVPGNTPIGAVKTAWGGQTDIVAAKNISFLRWRGTPLTTRKTLHPSRGQTGEIGALAVLSGDTGANSPLEINSPAPGPSFWWRLTRR